MAPLFHTVSGAPGRCYQALAWGSLRVRTQAFSWRDTIPILAALQRRIQELLAFRQRIS